MHAPGCILQCTWGHAAITKSPGYSKIAIAMQLVKGDIQSADLIGHLLTQHKIDTVMHFAAQVSSQYPARLTMTTLQNVSVVFMAIFRGTLSSCPCNLISCRSFQSCVLCEDACRGWGLSSCKNIIFHQPLAVADNQASSWC